MEMKYFFTMYLYDISLLPPIVYYMAALSKRARLDSLCLFQPKNVPLDFASLEQCIGFTPGSGRGQNAGDPVTQGATCVHLVLSGK